MSIILVYFQLLLTVAATNSVNTGTSSPAKRIKAIQENNLAKTIIYGDDEIQPLQICRWEWITEEDTGRQGEIPPANCEPNRLDIAIHTPNPATFDVTPYLKKMEGNVERLHVCRQDCAPDIVLSLDNGASRVEAKSVWGLMVLRLVQFNSGVYEAYQRAHEEVGSSINLLGNIRLHASGFTKPIDITNFIPAVLALLNIAFLVVVALWLALKAHRKVLDYFARNGSLLPMVAAIGHHPFYRAIWILTLLRVGVFLLAAVPVTITAFNGILKQELLSTLFKEDLTNTALWALASVLGLGLATMIASISELKQRHQLLSFVYRYLPLLIAGIGTVFWIASFILDEVIISTSLIGLLRCTITALPVLGLAPTLIAPVFQPPAIVLAIHILLTLGLIVYILKENARWFAAHLEAL